MENVRQIPLVSLRELEQFKAIRPLAATETKYGTIGIPDKLPPSELKNMIGNGGKKLDDAWKQYDCHLMEIQLDVNPEPKHAVNWVHISCILKPHRPSAGQAFCQGGFPSD